MVTKMLGFFIKYLFKFSFLVLLKNLRSLDARQKEKT